MRQTMEQISDKNISVQPRTSGYTRHLLASVRNKKSCAAGMELDMKFFNELLELPTPKKEKAVVSYLISLTRPSH